MIVRISRASYPPERHAEVTALLDAAAATLVPTICQLPGCTSFYAASDQASSTMINVSVWDTLEQTNAIVAPMLALAKQFTQLGVEFERPIVNYAVLWQMP